MSRWIAHPEPTADVLKEVLDGRSQFNPWTLEVNPLSGVNSFEDDGGGSR